MKCYSRSLLLALALMAVSSLHAGPLQDLPSSDTKMPASMIGGHFVFWVSSSSHPETMRSGTQMNLTLMDDNVMLSFFDNGGNHQQVLLGVTGYSIESNDLTFELHYLGSEGNEQRLKITPEGSDLSTGAFTLTNSPAALGFEEAVGTFTYKAP